VSLKTAVPNPPKQGVSLKTAEPEQPAPTSSQQGSSSEEEENIAFQKEEKAREEAIGLKTNAERAAHEERVRVEKAKIDRNTQKQDAAKRIYEKEIANYNLAESLHKKAERQFRIDGSNYKTYIDKMATIVKEKDAYRNEWLVKWLAQKISKRKLDLSPNDELKGLRANIDDLKDENEMKRQYNVGTKLISPEQLDKIKQTRTGRLELAKDGQDVERLVAASKKKGVPFNLNLFADFEPVPPKPITVVEKPDPPPPFTMKKPELQEPKDLEAVIEIGAFKPSEKFIPAEKPAFVSKPKQVFAEMPVVKAKNVAKEVLKEVEDFVYV
jgi:hypothetical protein